MKQALSTLVTAFGLSLLLSAPVLATCPADSVQVGPICVDKYEASVWSIPANKTSLLNKVKNGTATLNNLTSGGAMQHGALVDDYPCSNDGNDCKDEIYAVSIPGVIPSGGITWFQAQQACANAGKRLLTNAEWQMAAAGTPDPGVDNKTTSCNINGDGEGDGPPITGSRSACVSAWGAFDMVGSWGEWVADWIPKSTACASPLFADDLNCFAGASTSSGPGVLVRGGSYADGSHAGVFSLSGGLTPIEAYGNFGFRCGR